MFRLIVISFCLLMGLQCNAFAKQSKLRNFCSNGGFEELNVQGFPAEWNGFASEGASFGVSRTAHSGDYALLLKSTSDAVVGINRDRDALMPLPRGIAKFWYKAVSSEVEGKNLQVCIIAMNESGDSEVGRKIYVVPPEHVGDGEWHFAEMEFDFKAREDASQIHFAPRINETTTERAVGELLLDDVEVTMIGPKLILERFGVAEPLIQLDETTDVCLVVKNVGDQDTPGSEVGLSLPVGVVADGADVLTSELEGIEPDESATLNWQVTGKRPVSGTIEAVVDSSISSAVYLTVSGSVESELRLGNEYIFLEFPKTEHGYGIFTIEQPGSDVSRPLAQSSMFGSLIYRTDNGAIKYVPLFADELQHEDGRCVFRKQFLDVDGVTWDFEFIFDLPPDQKWVNVIYRARAEKEREILAFYGPVLYTRRHSRYDAIFPGLEYLEGDELSSSTLDIVTPNHIRRVPHPNKVTVPLMAVSENVGDGSVITGMMWDARRKWSKNSDRPSAVFASPNWFECMENYDVMGLFAPSVPDWVEENQTQAKVPYHLQPGDSIEIEAQLFSIHNPEPDFSAIYAVPYWIEKYGLPEPLPLPRKTLERELEFGLRAYMDTLWVAEEEAWHNTLDWDPWGIRVNPEFARQLWLAAKVLPANAKTEQYLERAEFAFEKLGNNPGREIPFYIGRLDEMYPRFMGAISRLMQSQKEDGSWRFDPDSLNAADEIHHQDYHKLGEEGAVEIGMCAQRAYILLRYASTTGDEVSLEAGLKALDFMKRFRVPRAAQVWEVPVHTPDILASAHAVQAYLEAYKITREQSYLDAAVYWAYTGLPFFYLWSNDDMPYMLYASIPVFGATWFTHSWFGVAVQWNGLDYAYALFDLAKYDDSLPWYEMARGLTVSGLYQQETREEYEGLYPDSYNFMDKTTAAWKLSPSGIIRNLFVLMGYPAEPDTIIVGKKVHISAAVYIEEPELSDAALRFSLKYPPGMDGYVMIAGLDRPGLDDVMKDQQIIQEADDLESVMEGWKYDERSGLLFVKLKRDMDRMRITISKPQTRYVPQISRPAKEINWRFSQGGLRDWTAASGLTQFRIEERVLVTKSTSSDPYMVSAPTRINSSEYSRIVVRMKTSKGRNAQLFWSTDREPIGEATSMRFEIRSDGEFHDYVIPVAEHEKWKGVITSLRLDPTDLAGSEIAVESIVGRKED